jgi:uncharacterized protein (DUF1501 family)
MSRRVCCDEFSRSALLHRAAAQAGNGLPPIETGMPLPAGTGLDRRSFLLRSAGLALSVYGASRLPLAGFDDGLAAAASANSRVLVSVFLEGGADSISVLYPPADPLYRRLRPRLALPDSAGRPFAEDPRLRWHPSAASLALLHEEGKVATFPAIGYTNADQSHFTSRHYYEVGATDPRLRTGWLGRYLDRMGSPDNPIQGLSLGGSLAPPLAAATVPVAAIEAADGYTFWTPGVWGDVEKRLQQTVAALGAARSSDPQLTGARRIVAQAETLRRQLAPFVAKDGRKPVVPAAYPKSRDPLPARLAGLAAMLGAGLPIRCVALDAFGEYDTHNNQPDTLSAGLKLTSDSLLAFQRDLENRNLADRVLVLVWSEFGRRAKENASRGTDHGAAGIGFLIGTAVRGEAVGDYPSLSKLDQDGNFRPTSDFRGVYSALLEQWLDTDAGAVIPGAKRFARPRLVR